MKQKQMWKRVLCALLIFVLSFTVLSMIGSAVIFRVIYPRHDEPDAFTLRYEDIDSARYPREELSFSSGDNRLTAYHYQCSEPEGMVVIAAGIGDGANSHLCEMMDFVDGGFDVFCYDATGVGESEGEGIVGLSQAGVDLRAALEYIEGDSSMSRLPLLLYAHSCGGYGALTCVADDSVKAAVVICAFESPERLMFLSAREKVGFLADVEYPFMAIENRLLFGEWADIHASDCLKNCQIPVLVLEGEKDKLIPEELRLSSYREQIDNPLVSYQLYDAGHTDLWLSRESQQYRETASDSEEPDRVKANETDDAIMGGILSFYRDAIKK